MDPPKTPKRARAETHTRSSPQHIRTRVEEPKLDFTLFDESETPAIIPTSAFDDQLSDNDSDYELPPLTPSPPGSELGSEGELDSMYSLAQQ